MTTTVTSLTLEPWNSSRDIEMNYYPMPIDTSDPLPSTYQRSSYQPSECVSPDELMNYQYTEPARYQLQTHNQPRAPPPTPQNGHVDESENFDYSVNAFNNGEFSQFEEYFADSVRAGLSTHYPNGNAIKGLAPGQYEQFIDISSHLGARPSYILDPRQYGPATPKPVNDGFNSNGYEAVTQPTSNTLLGSTDSCRELFQQTSEPEFTGLYNYQPVIAQPFGPPTDAATNIAGFGFGTGLSTIDYPEQAPRQLFIKDFCLSSRVETQIDVKLYLAPAADMYTRLHLPRHSVSKAKQLASQPSKDAETLELDVAVVGASAMKKPRQCQHALDVARTRKSDFEPKGVRTLVNPREKKELARYEHDPESALNGGFVHICDKCIEREQKRANRKRTKQQGANDQLWRSYEQDRVLIFNHDEYVDWQESSYPEDSTEANKMRLNFVNTDGFMSVELKMRITCYCRHHFEESGFRVIFTLKDLNGNVVAQNMSTSINITDEKPRG